MLQELIFFKFLTKYRERSILLQVFMLVECIGNAIYIEEAYELTITMAIVHSKPKLKYEANHIHVHGSLAKTKDNSMLYCWKCWKDGHNKKDCFKFKLKNGKEKAKNPSQDKKPQKTPKHKQCTYCNCLWYVDLLIMGWPYQGHFGTEIRQGLNDLWSNLFWRLMQIIHWWFKHQCTPLIYILEIVSPLGDTIAKIVSNG